MLPPESDKGQKATDPPQLHENNIPVEEESEPHQVILDHLPHSRWEEEAEYTGVATFHGSRLEEITVMEVVDKTNVSLAAELWLLCCFVTLQDQPAVLYAGVCLDDQDGGRLHYAPDQCWRWSRRRSPIGLRCS